MVEQHGGDILLAALGESEGESATVGRARSMRAHRRLDAQESPVDGVDDAIAKGSQVSDRAAQFGCRNVGDGRHEEHEVSTAELDDRHQSPGYGADLRLCGANGDDALDAQ